MAGGFDFSSDVAELRESFRSGITLPCEYRISQLKALDRLLQENRDLLLDAVYKDFKKSTRETQLTELTVLRGDLLETIDNLHEWMQLDVVPSDLLNKSATCALKYDPMGVVLVIGAWNYPISLSIQPFVGAIAAGCCGILKPSEVSPNTADVLGKLFPKYMDQKCYRLINGGVGEVTALLKERYDLIFFTGGTMVGKIVMEAAAKKLTPVVLELGGKSPCYIHDDSDMELVANRVGWGKFVNAGQTCIAPDYVLCSEKTQEKLITHMKKTVNSFYGPNPEESPHYARIVNHRHFKRVQKLIDPDKVVIGGKYAEGDNFIEPTVLANVDPKDPIMQEEIFGPVLPILTVKSMEDAIDFINSGEKPLTLYVFAKNQKVVNNMLERTTSGGVCVNDTVVQAGVPTLPFGGVGYSGTGSYHGRNSFLCFSHKKSCLIKKQNMEAVTSIRYPPYSDNKLKIINFLLVATRRNLPYGRLLRFICYGVVAAVLLKAFGIDDMVTKTYSEWTRHK